MAAHAWRYCLRLASRARDRARSKPYPRDAGWLAAIGLAIAAASCAPQAPPGPADVSQMVDGGKLANAREDLKTKPLYPLDVGAPDPAAKRFCDALHALPQARRAQCCGGPPARGLADECTRTLTAATRDGSVRLDGPASDRCNADSTRALTGCEWVTPVLPPAPSSCRQVVQGQLAAGASCRSNLECKDGLHCAGLGVTTAGKCTEPSPSGAACAPSVDALAAYTDEVDLNLHHPLCAGSCQSGRCTDTLAVGAACFSSGQCAATARCNSGRCAPNVTAGIGEACDGGNCVTGAICSGGHCVALKGPGEVCTQPFECRGACVRPPGAPTGVCGMQCPGSPANSILPPRGN